MIEVDGGEEGTITLAYPEVRRDLSVTEEHFGGELITDPYRHLEDPEADETREFVAQQNALTQAYLFHCGVDREQILEQLRANYDYPKIGSYERVGRAGTELIAYWKKEGLQNQPVLYTAESERAPLSILLDPNLLSDDGTTSVGAHAFSRDATKLAYALSTAGSDWRTIYVRDVASAMDERDALRWCKFTSIEWAHDGSGFFYNRFPAPAGDAGDAAAAAEPAAAATRPTTGMQLAFHRLGAPQRDDVVVFACADGDKLLFSAELTRDGACLVLLIRRGKFNQVWYREMGLGGVPSAPPEPAEEGAPSGADPVAALALAWGFKPLIDNFDAKWELVTTDGPVWTFFTNQGAPRYHIVAIDVRRPLPAEWRVVVPESEHTLGGGDYARGGHCVDERLILKYMNDAKDELHQYTLDGTFERAIPLPGPGVVSGISGEREHSDLHFRFESFLTPPMVLRYVPATGELVRALETTVSGLDTSDFEVEQRFVTSKDGATRVPMFVVRPKQFLHDGDSPAALFAYGGFNVVKGLTFDPLNLTLLQLLSVEGESMARSFWQRGVARGAGRPAVRGIWALANIRGGGEYGREWHEAGMKANKPNCFDDFIACAEHLVEHGFTSPRRLCIQGASNGGLLVAACANMRPDLFACVTCQVGLLDMLRFHKFTIGWAWCSEYGSPDEEADFPVLAAYSPYHNVARDTAYPAMIFTTADHDDRVVPLHTYKMVAELQYVAGRLPTQLRPILARIETKAGHGAGTATSKRLAQAADVFAFVLKALDVKLPVEER